MTYQPGLLALAQQDMQETQSDALCVTSLLEGMLEKCSMIAIMCHWDDAWSDEKGPAAQALLLPVSVSQSQTYLCVKEHHGRVSFAGAGICAAQGCRQRG